MGTVAAFTTAAIAKIISDTNVTVAIDELIGNDFAIASGVAVVRGGEHTGAKPGMIVRGPGYRP